MMEVMKLCDSKEGILRALGVGAQCPGTPLNRKAMQLAHAALRDVPGTEVCLEVEKRARRLKPIGLDNMPIAATVPSSRCLSSHQRCSGDERCRPAVQAAALWSNSGSGATGAMVEMLKLCDSKALFSAVDVVAECPGPSRMHFRELRTALAHSSAGKSCVTVQRQANRIAEDLVPERALALPLSCVVAQQECGSDGWCQPAVQAASNSGAADELIISALDLCSSRAAMLRVLAVVAECPGPMAKLDARGALETLKRLPKESLCATAAELKEQLHPPAFVPTERVLAAVDKAVAVEASKLARETAASILATFDVVPKDGRLNAVEMAALLREAESDPEAGEALLGRGELTSSFAVALDGNSDGFVGVRELEQVLRARLLPLIDAA